ncbi:hypothetical protein [Kocuria sp. KH4]
MSLDKMQQSPNHPTLRAQRARVVSVEQYATERADAWRYFGRLLRAERLLRGITRERALEAMDLHSVHHDYVLQEIEAGTHELDVTWARRMQERLGMPVVHLMIQAGVATVTELAATGDDMPLAGRPVPAPARGPVRRSAAHRRAEALAVIGTVLGAVLLTAALVLFVAGYGGWGALVGAIGWLVVSPPLAIIGARLMDNQTRRG